VSSLAVEGMLAFLLVESPVCVQHITCSMELVWRRAPKSVGDVVLGGGFERVEKGNGRGRHDALALIDVGYPMFRAPSTSTLNNTFNPRATVNDCVLCTLSER
jgi:hypothetical protein